MGMVGLPTEEAFDYSINEIIKAKNIDEKELEYTVAYTFPESKVVALSLQRKKPIKPILVKVGDDIEGRAWEMFERTPGVKNWFKGPELLTSGGKRAGPSRTQMYGDAFC